MKISVVIHTYNAEKHLSKVLESVKGFDEIIICDMYSTDKTIQIAEEYNCKIIYHKNTGFPEPARTYAIQSATHDWVLTIDADEIVTKELREFLYKQIERIDCPAGLWIPRKNYFMGHFMHSTYPDFLLRFFKKEGTVWPPYVHTFPNVQGQTEKIPAKRKDLALIHIANDSIETVVKKNNIYTNDERLKRKGQKYGYFSLFYQPAFRFFKSYILKGGIRDGKAGLVWASLNAFYKLTTIAKIWESQIQVSDYDKELKE